MLKIINLHVQIGNKKILNGINISINSGEIHAVMGPNGAGKTTLAMSLMGHPGYKKIDGEISINNKDIISLLPEERARIGLFVSFQQPIEISGVSFLSFLRTAHKALYPDIKIPLSQFKQSVINALKVVHLDENFMQRSINEGFSGGEKKRAEIVQLIILQPKFAILDEIDSGLDIDSLKIVAEAVIEVVKQQKVGILIITHYQRILHYLKPDKVHVLIDGQIKSTGTISLVKKIEKDGYAKI